MAADAALVGVRGNAGVARVLRLGVRGERAVIERAKLVGDGQNRERTLYDPEHRRDDP